MLKFFKTFALVSVPTFIVIFVLLGFPPFSFNDGFYDEFIDWQIKAVLSGFIALLTAFPIVIISISFKKN